MALNDRSGRRLLAVGLGLAIISAACSSGPSAAPSAAAAVTASPAPSVAASAAVTASPTASAASTAVLVTAVVKMEHVAFTPASLTVAVGTTVVWSNQDGNEHTVTADDGSFESQPIPSHQSFRQTFSKAGTYAYHCSIHSNMKAAIIVK